VIRSRASQRNRAATEVEPAFIQTPEAAALAAYGHTFEEGAEADDIGAVTGLELGPRGRMLASAEPIRRGGGRAAVVTPRP
jgi:gamma-glutamyltranspeptidase/glutathione hydrolase